MSQPSPYEREYLFTGNGAGQAAGGPDAGAVPEPNLLNRVHRSTSAVTRSSAV